MSNPMPVKTETWLDAEEIRVVNAFRHIREHRHGEMEVAVKEGKCVKLWTTDKWDGNETPKLRETPEPRT